MRHWQSPCRILAVSFVFALLVAPLASATTITVRQDGTGDHTTIQGAVAAAADGDTIEVGPGSYTGPAISVIAGTLTFVSTDGAEATILDGEGTNQIFDFHLSQIEIAGFEFRNGFDDHSGGAISFGGGTAQVRDCRFIANDAQLGGSAVHVTFSGGLSLEDCYFFRNGPEANSTVTVGGSSHMTVDRCTFTENYSPVLADGAAMDILDCLFFRNWGVVRFGSGATGSLRSSTLDSNPTFFSGSIAAVWAHDGSGVEIAGNIISNTRRGYGLGYFFNAEGPHSCNVFFNNEYGPIEGGTLAANEVVADPEYCDPYNSNYLLSSSSPAAAANNLCGQVGRFAVGCSISDPQQPKVITVAQSGPADFDNIRDAVSAAFFLDTVQVAPGTYTELVDVYRSVTIRSTGGADVTILDGQGSAQLVRVRRPVDVWIAGFSFENGHTSGSGGAIVIEDAWERLEVTDCRFANNWAGRNGGAISFGQDMYHDVGLLVSACSFEGNHAESFGGAVQSSRAGTFSACEFNGNTATWGGALASYSGQMSVSECLFVGNSSRRGGAVLFGWGQSGDVFRSTFHGNISSGGTIESDSLTTTDVTRCILSGNSAGWGLVRPSTNSCNVFWENQAGAVTNGALDATDVVSDPMFCDAPTGVFTIAAGSPAAPAESACGELIGALPVGCTRVPTLISGFHARPSGEHIDLAWEIISDDVLLGFRLLRTDIDEGNGVVLPATGLLDASTRRHVDEGVRPGHKYEYTLVVVRDGQSDVLSISELVSTPALAYSLAQNAPNPFRSPGTSISYTLAESAPVRLDVFTVDGRRVRTLVDTRQSAGTKRVTWDGRDDRGQRVASNIYFYRLSAGSFHATRKMVLIR